MVFHGMNGGNGNLQGVILDMDGVIIDSHPAHHLAWQEFLEAVGQSVSEAELKYILDGRKRNEILRHFFGKLSDEEILEYGTRKDEFFRRVSLEVKPVAGILEFLNQAKQASIGLAIATSASGSRTRSTMERLLVTDHFQVIVTGDDVDFGKPDPAIYRLACQRLGISPDSAVAVEDAVSGIKAAKGAGICCVAVSGHESAKQLRDAGADHVIENFISFSPADLRSILRRNHQRIGARQNTANAAV